MEIVCEDTLKKGYDFVEAYPNIEFINTKMDFMGPKQLYVNLGFEKNYLTKDRIVMRKKLK